VCSAPSRCAVTERTSAATAPRFAARPRRRSDTHDLTSRSDSLLRRHRDVVDDDRAPDAILFASVLPIVHDDDGAVMLPFGVATLPPSLITCSGAAAA
jgi:hypothetical protein